MIVLQPVREGVVGGARGRQGTDTGIEFERRVEVVPQVTGHDHLCRVALAGVGRPRVEEVMQLGIKDPAPEADVYLLKLEVITRIDTRGAPEIIGIAALEILLIQIAGVAENPEVDFTHVRVEQVKAFARPVAQTAARIIGRALGGRCAFPVQFGFQLLDALIELLVLLLQVLAQGAQFLKLFFHRRVGGFSLYRIGKQGRAERCRRRGDFSHSRVLYYPLLLVSSAGQTLGAL